MSNRTPYEYDRSGNRPTLWLYLPEFDYWLVSYRDNPNTPGHCVHITPANGDGVTETINVI